MTPFFPMVGFLPYKTFTNRVPFLREPRYLKVKCRLPLGNIAEHALFNQCFMVAGLASKLVMFISQELPTSNRKAWDICSVAHASFASDSGLTV